MSSFNRTLLAYVFSRVQVEGTLVFGWLKKKSAKEQPGAGTANKRQVAVGGAVGQGCYGNWNDMLKPIEKPKVETAKCVSISLGIDPILLVRKSVLKRPIQEKDFWFSHSKVKPVDDTDT